MSRTIWIAACIAQVLLVAVIAFVPFGFDHTTGNQLDFNYLILAAFLLCVAFLVGLVAEIAGRNPAHIPNFIFTETAIMVAFVIGLMIRLRS